MDDLRAANPDFGDGQLEYRMLLSDQIFRHKFDSTPRFQKLDSKYAAVVASMAHQNLEPLLSVEKTLLEMSDVENNPHEVAVLLIQTKTRVMTTQYIVGGKTGIVISVNSLLATVRDFLRTSNETVTQVTFTHTHPAYDVSVNDTLAQMTTLSSADLNTAQKLSAGLGGIPLSMRAAIPNGYAYQNTFINGVRQ